MLPHTAVMDTCHPTLKVTLQHEFSLIQQATTSGISTKQHKSGDTMWDIWQDFCHSISTNPYLTNTDDPIPIMQLFAHRYRTGGVAIKSILEWWRTPFMLWGRHSPH